MNWTRIYNWEFQNLPNLLGKIHNNHVPERTQKLIILGFILSILFCLEKDENKEHYIPQLVEMK